MADPLSLCDRCLGRRIVGAIGAEAQTEAGAAHRTAEPAAERIEPADCAVCEDAFRHLDIWIDLAVAALAEDEGTTFQVGTVFPVALEKAEKAIVLNDTMTDTIRTEANRLIGPAIAERTGKQWSTDGRPDVVVSVDTRFHHADTQSNSIFMAGRYTKQRRDIPQTHWPCKRCQGLGCWECDDAGVLYAESVEDAIADQADPVFGAAGHAFHGAGREDIDALMLGNGRPFVLELKGPRRRNVDLQALQDSINNRSDETGVGVTDLRMTEKEEVARIKGGEYQKEYLAHCVAEAPVTADQVAEAAASFAGQVLDQRTPERVSHRRADLVRKRTVERITVEEGPDADGTRFSLRVLAESGTYIKEMVSSDDGRTVPSFAERLGVPTVVEFLDVVAILD